MSAAISNEDSLAEEPSDAREALACRIARLEHDAAAHQALLDNMSSGLAVYRAVEDGGDFVITNINRAGERISRARKEDLIGKRLREAFPGVAEFGLLDVLRAVWRTGEPQRHGPSLYRDARITHWAENYVYRLPDCDVVAVYDDVTEREQVTAELRLSEERFRTLAERLPIGLYRTTPEGQISYLNRALQTMLGYPDEESLLRLRAGVGYVDPFERQRFLGVMARDGVCQAFESQWRTWDGRLIWIRESARVVRNPDGVPLYFEGTAEDITEQRTTREALEQAEERFRRFAEAVSDVMYRYDVRTNRYDFISPAFERLTGFGREELTPDPVRRTRRFVHPGDAKRVYRSLYERFRQGPGKGPFQIDYRIVTKDGRVLWVSDRIDLEFGPDGAIHRMNGVIRDITDLKQAEQERERLACRLSERVKELNCLSAVSTVLGRAEGPLAAIVSDAVTPLPAGMRFSEIAAACVILRDEEACTPGFQRTAWRMEAPLLVKGTSEGLVEVCYVAEPPPDAGDPFLPEEVRLLEDVAERIARRVERWDVTEALRGSEERFRDLVEKARIGILIDDPQGKFRYLNDTFAAMFGYSREEMSGLTIETIVHPLDLERVVAQHRGRVQGSAPWAHYEFMGIRKNRLPIYVEVDALELREGDQVVGTRSYVWDISERKAAEQERERLIGELKDALAKVKTLSGLLPICSNCKRIRDDAGYWQKVETFIHQRSDAEFTHGICPDCMKKLYPEFADDASAPKE